MSAKCINNSQQAGVYSVHLMKFNLPVMGMFYSWRRIGSFEQF